MRPLARASAIAANTFREALRNRAFLGLLVMTLSFLIFSMVMAELAVRGEKARVVQDFGLFSMSLFGVLIAIVMGVILVYKELEKKTIYTIIPKPVRRWEFILGKYLGMLGLLFVEVAVMALVWLFVLWSKDATINADTFKAIVLIFFEIALVSSIAVFFSAFSSPILSGVFTAGIFTLGRTAYIVGDMLEAKKGLFVDFPEFRPLGELYVATCPNLTAFNVSQDLLLDIPVQTSYVFASGLYALSYVVFFLCLAMLLFERRDFV